jgi:biotin carboxyl carrier protein
MKPVKINENLFSVDSKKELGDIVDLIVSKSGSEKKKYSAKVLDFDKQLKCLLFALNDRVYKAKATLENGRISAVYIFNFNREFKVNYSRDDIDFEGVRRDLSDVNLSSEIPVQSGFSEASSILNSPLGGRVTKLFVETKQQVVVGQPLVTIESMKMENEICSDLNAVIKTLSISEGNLVQPNEELMTFELEGDLYAKSKN